jgi:hypothetical protein
MPQPPQLAAIGTWIDSLDEAQVQERIQALSAEIAVLSGEYQWLQRALELKQQWRTAIAQGQVPVETAAPAGGTRVMVAVPEAHFPLDADPPPRGKTAAVLRVLGSDPQRKFSSQTIRDYLVERGWMTAEEGDYASLLSTLSRMTTDRQIRRIGRGIYRLAPDDGTGR